jgi:hypothetical protein
MSDFDSFYNSLPIEPLIDQTPQLAELPTLTERQHLIPGVRVTHHLYGDGTITAAPRIDYRRVRFDNGRTTHVDVDNLRRITTGYGTRYRFAGQPS